MTKTISLTSKNQVSLPAALVRRAGLTKGARFLPRLDNGAIVLEPEQDLRATVQQIQAELRPLTAHPLSDKDLQKALHEWPKK
jgi:antitoxin component of MazEF toxin-antitoxin module